MLLLLNDMSSVISDLFNPENLIRYGGLTLLLIIIFAETGLFFGFFLPGDSLLFMAGLLAESEYIGLKIWILIPVLVLAAASGTTVGYFFGRWAGGHLKNRKENFFYKKQYIILTEDFYKRYGMMAFVVGRFLPIIRTFVPILAGMARIDWKKFLVFNLLGAILWIVTMVMAGHWMGKSFPGIINHLEWIVVGLVLITTIPLIYSWMKNKHLFNKKESPETPKN
jgi:membrane-associated protein